VHAITLYRHESAGEAVLEYNFYDHQFAPTNLVVRKVLMAMLAAVKARLTHLEVEYNDQMLADKFGKRASELLRLLGATRENVRENRSGEQVISRTFRAELTAERYDYFYQLKDVAELSHYRLLEDSRERIVFYFNRYLAIRLPLAEEQQLYQQLATQQVPYQIKDIG
jgi:hypothetical protein